MSAPDSSPPPYSPTPPGIVSADSVPRARSTPHLRGPASTCFAARSSSLTQPSTPPSYSQLNGVSQPSGEEPEDTCTSDDDMLSISAAGTIRSRLLKRKGRIHDESGIRPITTAHGILGAGETETESEEMPRNLPTARITTPALSPISSPALPSWFIPFLFLFSRFLSIVPAVFGTLWNVYHIIWPPTGSGADTLRWRVDFLVSALWSILTGWQCLQFTTGLLKRWRVYYSPLPTLIRLFALQAICWPATHLTLTVLNHEQRPALCWAVIGTTTCYSRAIQLWVTSNIGPAPEPVTPAAGPAPPLRQSLLASASGLREEWMRLRRRRWDWGEVGRKCVLPAGVVYFVMAWADMLRRELERAAW
ncbi:hypothetical protein WOLCODRAFT_139576 [Wolfiporia cocos MD-104 SS10]|uniref:N-glycosylation protein EOS1 n=1 Tax=Wolfiporia cocos (strain MD-104) TaxID=742152 RepID=A0A2H3J4S2_WOLCO|nr:hypothetical protein WOLCODRAFT_139576 [Wolfiporia cocos MD-104 SS10]